MNFISKEKKKYADRGRKGKKKTMMKEIKEEKFLFKNKKKGKFANAYLCGMKAYINESTSVK